MSNWYMSQMPDSIAVSSRIRLARNIEGLPFPSRMSAEDRKNLNERVKKAILESNTPFARTLKFINMADVPENEKYSMVERHIISPEFAASRMERAIIISDDESISIMIGEEDHLRIQVIYGGLELEKAYDTAEKLDKLLCDALDFAFDKNLGFLTECPTNLGTGLRASVMLHLPVVESEGGIADLSQSVNKIGFTVRGMYGEGSKSVGALYQISNQITLGISEKNALDNLKIITIQLMEREQKAREALNKLKVEDMCMRAFGILSNARILSSDELIKLISRIKLGISLGIIEKGSINPMKLLVEAQPYMLMRKFGSMSPDERDIYRASLVRQELTKRESEK